MLCRHCRACCYLCWRSLARGLGKKSIAMAWPPAAACRRLQLAPFYAHRLTNCLPYVLVMSFLCDQPMELHSKNTQRTHCRTLSIPLFRPARSWVLCINILHIYHPMPMSTRADLTCHSAFVPSNSLSSIPPLAILRLRVGIQPASI